MAVNETSTDKNICVEAKMVPDCLKPSWFTAQTPFALPSLRLPNSKLSTLVSRNLNLRELRRSMNSAVDKFFRLLHLLACENPVVKKVLSLSPEFQSLCEQVISFSFAITFLYFISSNNLISYDLVSFMLNGLHRVDILFRFAAATSRT